MLLRAARGGGVLVLVLVLVLVQGLLTVATACATADASTEPGAPGAGGQLLDPLALRLALLRVAVRWIGCARDGLAAHGEGAAIRRA